MINYTYNGKYYRANENYFFLSNKTGIISKTIYLNEKDFIDNYSLVIEHTPPEGYIYQKISDETIHNPLLLSETDSLLNYKLIPIKDETESI